MPTTFSEWAQTLSAIIIAFGVVYNIYLAHQTRKDVHLVEVNTNSMKDALVTKAGELGTAEGTLAGIAHEQIRMGTSVPIDTGTATGTGTESE